MEEVVIGSMAPDFCLPAAGGDVTLSSLRGKKVVLYFYPRDNTPGCSNEAGEFRDRHAAFAALGAEILAISRDSISSHQKFAAKLDLPFLLLSDADGSVCQLYNVLKEKNLYGHKTIGVERSTFIIDEAGTVVQVYRKIKAAGHAAIVLDYMGGC